MIAVGERINGMFSDVKKAIKERNPGAIHDLARRQTEAGASYLDVNVGPGIADQVEAMKWLVSEIQEVSKTPVSIDSQKIEVAKAGLEAASAPALINSCKSLEVLNEWVDLALKHNSSLVCLTIDKRGIPQDIDTRMELAASIVGTALERGLEPSRLFIDPILFPVNVDQKQPSYLLEVCRQITYISDPPPHIICGLSNLSQGTKERGLINRAYLTMALPAGLDSAVMDVLDNDLMDAAITTEMLLNKQIYSDAFLKAARS
ncbi:MAG: dihydropteroate synthase [Candidatus Brocadiales bacterium]